MKQVVQRLDNGIVSLCEVPIPTVSRRQVLVQTRASVISAGTERMLVGFGRSSFLRKVHSQPEKVRDVIRKIGTDGIAGTIEAVRAKLESPIPLGYCQAGVVANVGEEVSQFAIGDRVISNGYHAEYVRVAQTLCARIPDSVSFERAAFAPLAAIGLQGVRLAAPTIGETVVVFGLGLVGLLSVQILRANGCRVIGIDTDDDRIALAEAFGAVGVSPGATNVVDRVFALTAGIGADAVLLTLASSSDEPIQQAAQMSRQRGRVILVGVTGLTLSREDFFAKELSFAVSCSYGPGRYDPAYEERGQDYPIGFVRWTEQRNFEAVLSLMADGSLDPEPLITHRIPIEDSVRAYEVLTGPDESLGIVLEYPVGNRENQSAVEQVVTRRNSTFSVGHEIPRIAVIGAGNYSIRTLLPSLRRLKAELDMIVSSGGTSAGIAAEKFGFTRVASDIAPVLKDPSIDTVFVVTRHDSHATLAIRCLQAGKHVFVEKPLALTETELDSVERAVAESGKLLTVGFNRRHAPLTAALQRELRGRSGPLAVIATVNAGFISHQHWTQDPNAGGGRIVGEACHWVDLARALVGAPIKTLAATPARRDDGLPVGDIAHLSLAFEDGSTAVVHYLANGSRKYPKERIECFFDGRTVAIENWRRLRDYDAGTSRFALKRRADKGHVEELRIWLNAVKSGISLPIPIHEIFEVSRWSIRAAELVRAGGSGPKG